MLAEPRIQPSIPDDWTEEQRELVARASLDDEVLNVFATLVRHPKLFKRWLVFAVHVLSKSSLTPRDRELVILRTAWRCRSDYEWGQHRPIAAGAGIDPDEIARVAAGPRAPGWSAGEAALLRAVDELLDDRCISDDTWRELASRYDEDRIMDLMFTVGNYAMLAAALNSMGVQREPGVAGFEAGI